jgi:histidine triad (HIT) family protein
MVLTKRHHRAKRCTTPVGGAKRLIQSSSKQNIPKSALAVKPEETIFAKIVSKEIPAKIVFEDDQCMAFHDIAPVAPVHILVIPKRPIGEVTPDFSNAAIFGHLMVAARKVADEAGLGESGFRLVVNNGSDALQSVNWLHIHVIGGKKLSWPPGI